MAHFAELDSNNVVLEVVVISNDDVAAHGGDYTPEAENFVASLVPHSENGVAWKQTSYNGNARKQYAGIGFSWDPVNAVFISPQPYPSWSLDSNFDWQPPVPFPTEDQVGQLYLLITWNEEDLRWDGLTESQDEPPVITNYYWDSVNLIWVEING